MNKERMKEVLTNIEKDMENDAKNFDGKPFDGKTVAQYFGYQGAAIAALAKAIRVILEEEEPCEKR